MPVTRPPVATFVTMTADLGPSGAATRDHSTTYTNTANTPRMVIIDLINAGAGATYSFLIGGVIVAHDVNAAVVAQGMNTFIVPAGATYRLNRDAASGSVALWFECN